MTGDPLYTRSGNWREIYGWAEHLPLHKAEPKRRTRPDTNTRLVHARKMLAKALTRERRATTIRMRWQAKVKRLERGALPVLAEAAMGVQA